MNIYSKHGDKVVFNHPENGLQCDKDRAKKHLTVGGIYTIDSTDVHSFSTNIFLVEVPEISFNSVLFSDTSRKMKLNTLKNYKKVEGVLDTNNKIDEFRTTLKNSVKEKFKDLDRAKIETMKSAKTKIIG